MVKYVILVNHKRQTLIVSSWNELVTNLAESDIRGVTEIYLHKEIAEAKHRAIEYRKFLREFKP